MIDKILKAAMIVGFLCAVGLSIQFARADDKVCENGVWVEQAEAFKAAENIAVTQLNADQITSLVGKVGQPPHTEGDFDAFLVVNGPLAAVFIVQNGCTTDRLGPASASNIDNILGIVRAKGERVD